MTDQTNNPMNVNRGNGGSRPVPDPTALTDQAIARSDKAMRDYIDGEVKVLNERLRGIDEATKLRMGPVDQISHQVDEKVATLGSVMMERFARVDQKFADSAILSARESELNKVALDAAFKTQQEAAAKGETATAKTIDKNQELSAAQNEALGKGLDEVKERVTRLESTKAGATENRTGLYAGLAALGAVIGIVLAIAAVVSTRSGA